MLQIQTGLWTPILQSLDLTSRDVGDFTFGCMSSTRSDRAGVNAQGIRFTCHADRVMMKGIFANVSRISECRTDNINTEQRVGQSIGHETYSPGPVSTPPPTIKRLVILTLNVTCFPQNMK